MPCPRVFAVACVIAVLAATGCSSNDGASSGASGSTSTTVASEPSSTVEEVDPSIEANLLAAEAFIDAFYSYDSDRLAAALEMAPSVLPAIGFYQGWAEGANYKVLERSCESSGTLLVICPITVEDDLLLALGSEFKVTDTFTVYAEDGLITNITTSSDDPPDSSDAWSYMYDQSDLRAEGAPCEGFFDGGPTPGECARVWVEGYKQYATDNLSG